MAPTSIQHAQQRGLAGPTLRCEKAGKVLSDDSNAVQNA